MKEKLPIHKIIAYAIGQLGWSLLIGLINLYLVWFYLPPKDAGLPIFIQQGQILGFLTIIGIITMSGRLFDAFTDPVIASMSDRSKSKMGRRISFMAKGSIPLALFTFLVFYSPVNAESSMNVIWLFIVLLGFYLFFTVYTIPYTALISELGHTSEERLNISTAISVTFFVGTGIATMAPAMWGALVSAGYLKVDAVHLAIGGLAFFSMICMLVPVLVIDEKRYSNGMPSDVNLMESLKKTFKNKYFKFFVISDLVYFTALTVFMTGMIYYITVLLRLPEASLGSYNMMMFGISFVFYPIVNILARKFGKKMMLIFAFSVFSLMYFYTFILGMDFVPLSANVQAMILVTLAAIPMAIFGILPNVVVADIAEYDAVLTGEKREAMFFGARTLMTKIGQTIAMLIFSSLLLLGKDIGNDLGIRLTGPAAGILCVVGLVFFLYYNEKEVLAVLRKEEKTTK